MKESKLFQIISYGWILGLGLTGTIAYYVLYDEYIRGSTYGTIGAFVGSHGAVVAGTLHLINRLRGKG